MGPGHHPGTALPGQLGNAAIAGHRTTYGHPFYNLDSVHPGDTIDITTPQGTFVYKTFSTIVVAPTDVAVLKPTADPELTLTTCNPRYSAATRMIMRARLVGSLRVQSRRSGTTPSGKPPAQLDPGTGSSDWLAVAGWGAACAVIAVGAGLLARQSRHRWRWLVPGTVLFLCALFVFFSYLSVFLPPTI
jgi:sortase A